MKSAKLFLLFLSVIILNNCSHHKVKIDAVAAPDQMTDYEGVVTSEKKHAVSLAYYDLGMLNDKTKFMIIVENYGDKPIDFSTDNISVMFEGNSIDWSSKKIEIQSPSDVMKEIQRGIRMLTNMNKRYDRHAQDNFKILEFRQEQEQDIERVNRAIIKWKREVHEEMNTVVLGDIATKKAQSYYAIPRVIIQPQIIMPNESMSGFFVCDTGKMKNRVKGNFIISVRVGDEEHKFIFSRS